MRITSAWIAIALLASGAPCFAQSGSVQSITDEESSSPVQNLGFEREEPEGTKDLMSDWGTAGEVPSKKARPLTATEANKANYLTLTGGGGYRIDRVTPGPNDKIASVTIVYNGQFLELPGASISKGDSPGSLKAGLTSDDLKSRFDAAAPTPR